MNKIEIIPLGGIGEFGMNCMGIRYGDEMIIVDAGMGFPEETPYGVDISIPNFDFLDQYADDLSFLISQKIQDEMQYPGQIRVTVIREKRAVAFAR